MTRSRSGPLTAGLCAVVLVAGCTGLQPEAEPDLGITPPETWSTATDTAEPVGQAPATSDAWWSEFGEPTLNRQVESALSRNFSLQAAAARLDQALASAVISGADLKPQVSADFSGSRRRQNFIGFPIPGSQSGVLSSTSTNMGAGLNVSWEIDLWGRLQAVRDGSQSRALAAAADLSAARLSVSGQVAKAWFTTVEGQEQVVLAQANVASLQRTEKQVRRRYELGLRPALDLRLAMSSRANAQAALAQRQRLLDSSRRQLRALVGQYPDLSVQLEAGELPPLPATVPAGLPSGLLARRPDLAAARHRLAATGFAVRQAKASLYPQLRLTGSAGRASEELKDLLDSDFSVWSLAGNLLQPLFQGGRLRAGVDLSQARRQEAKANYSQLALAAFLEIENALSFEGSLEAQATALQEAAYEAEQAQKLAEERYSAGLVDYLSVLETQRLAFSARSQYLQIRRDHLLNRVDLHLALGGGFQAGAPAETASLSTPHKQPETKEAP